MGFKMSKMLPFIGMIVVFTLFLPSLPLSLAGWPMVHAPRAARKMSSKGDFFRRASGQTQCFRWRGLFERVFDRRRVFLADKIIRTALGPKRMFSWPGFSGHITIEKERLWVATISTKRCSHRSSKHTECLRGTGLHLEEFRSRKPEKGTKK